MSRYFAAAELADRVLLDIIEPRVTLTRSERSKIRQDIADLADNAIDDGIEEAATDGEPAISFRSQESDAA